VKLVKLLDHALKSNICNSSEHTGAALLENNEASAKLTTANGGTFLRAQLDSVANHVTTRSIGD